LRPLAEELDMTDQPEITIEQFERFLYEECVGAEEAALMMGVSGSHFRTLLATEECAPKPVRTGNKSVKYQRRDIEAFAAARAAEAKAKAAAVEARKAAMRAARRTKVSA
jgi:predicted DNA-binding transcriptional regulator AlpA